MSTRYGSRKFYLRFQSNFNVITCSLLEVLECSVISIDFVLIVLLSAFWVMLPAYLPNPVAALCGGGVPVDLGRNFSDGKRVLGDGKTYRGLIAGIAAGILIGLVQVWLQGRFGWQFLPQQTLLSITLLSVGALLGDMVKSFFKRRLGKERGAKWPVADMYDLVLGAFFLLLVFDTAWLFSAVTLPVLITILIMTPVLHRAVNIIGFIIKVKEVPW
ncbi:MAG: CDP-2,3-bis-(O-geranylgeranyl)-sn-glycerol synthase [Methanomicrobiales archaeon]|nr:CDP-2,3-bis-(O-geranylgeranyl)-sn-glycerol synthase [Methanomicrobiales archaeon]